MVSAQIKINIAGPGAQGELTVPPEVLNELGVQRGEQLMLEVVAGTLVVRRRTGLDRARGAGAPWQKIPPPTPAEESEAAARAIAEAGAQYE